MRKYEGYIITYNSKRYKVRYINPLNTVWLSPIVYENNDIIMTSGKESCISLKELENIMNETEMVYYI